MKGSVRKRKNGKFEFYYDAGKVVDENGVAKRKRISKSGFDTEELAWEGLKKSLEEFENKGRVFKDNNMSVSEYMQFYMDNYVRKKCKPRSVERYQEVINKHINPFFGHRYLRTIDAKLIEEFLDIKYKEGYAKKTMEFFITMLKHSLTLAIHPYEFLKEDNFSKAKLNYRFDYKKERNLTKEQLYEVLNYLKENYYEYYIVFTICWHTGMRRSEILGLTWNNIDLENKVIYVKQQQQWLNGGIVRLVEPKSKSGVRDIAVGDTLVDLLKEHREFVYKNAKDKSKQYVCINTKGNWMVKHNLAHILKVIRDNTKIHIGLHDVRHLHATSLVESSHSDIKSISHRLGHSSVTFSLDTYVKTTDTMKKNIANIFEESVL